MDWIKVLNRHILFEYSDLSDSEFRAWVKIMSLTAQLEHEPIRAQMLKYVHYKTLTSLQYKLNTRSIDLQYIVNKVLIDVQYTINKKKEWKENSQQYRERKRLEALSNKENVIETSRTDKIRLDKININNKPIIPEWIKKETWDAFLEMRKSLKAKPTQKAIELLIEKLRKYKNEGHDPNEIINQSIENNWKGVFPLKTGAQNDGRRTYRSPGTTYAKTERAGPGSGGGLKEYQPENPPDISEEDRQRNLAKLREITSG